MYTMFVLVRMLSLHIKKEFLEDSIQSCEKLSTPLTLSTPSTAFIVLKKVSSSLVMLIITYIK